MYTKCGRGAFAICGDVAFTIQIHVCGACIVRVASLVIYVPLLQPAHIKSIILKAQHYNSIISMLEVVP